MDEPFLVSDSAATTARVVTGDSDGSFDGDVEKGEKAALASGIVLEEFEDQQGTITGKPSSVGATVINLTKCFIGAASFELPWAFAQAGLLGSTVGILVLAAISTFGLTTLAKTSALARKTAGWEDSKKVATYPAIGEAAMGTFGKWAAWFGLLMMTLGVCGSYMAFIASQGSTLIWGNRENEYIVLSVSIVLVWIMSCIRNVRNLRFTSAFGILALFCAVAFATYDGAALETAPRIAFTDLPLLRLDTYPLFLGNAAFLYLISTAVLPISQQMKKPEKFHRSFTASAAIVTVLNVSFGIFAWAFGGVPCDIDDPVGWNWMRAEPNFNQHARRDH